jgi:BMFP domain-containing protein YqiC
MINTQFFEDLTQQIARLLPQAGAASEEVKKTVNAVLQKGFASLDLLTRQEFEAQAAALARAEERLAALEGEMARLEALLEKPVKP